MSKNSNEKREEKLRNKGHSILNDSEKPTIVAIKSDLTRTKLKSLIHRPLKPELRTKAIALYPFVVACGDDNAAGFPSPEAWADGFKDLVPEMEIFWWERFVLVIIHAVELLSTGNVSDQGYDEQLCRSAPVPSPDVLVNSTLAYLRKVDKRLLKMVHHTVFAKMNGVNIPGATENKVLVRVIGIAIEKVENARKAEYEKLRKLKEIRYGKVLGAACATCKEVSTKHKKCSRCHRTYYCGAECQKKHWKEHKKECQQFSMN